jgi:phosphomannomutase/glucose-6-phosphate isomerase
LISKYANEAKTYKWIDYEKAKESRLVEEIKVNEAIDRYVKNYIVKRLKEIGAWDTIINYFKRNPKFSVILDPMQGTSVLYLKAIFDKISEEVGRKVYKMLHTDNKDLRFKEVNGVPNPTEEENIKGLVSEVQKNKNSIGLATDGDADRFGVIDFGGKKISANEMIAILTYFLAEKGFKGAIGKTVPTSNFANEIAKYLGLKLIETPVGFKWMVEKVVKEKEKFLVAGEESAHVAVGPFINSWDDGIVMTLMALWVVCDSKKSLAEYKNMIEEKLGKKFYYRRDNVELTDELKQSIASLIEATKKQQEKGISLLGLNIVNKVNNIVENIGLGIKVKDVITLDGIKIVFDDGSWLCIRLSGSENVARLYTEVTDEKKQKDFVYLGKVLMGVEKLNPEKETGKLYSQLKESRDVYKEIGFDGTEARLGWVEIPNKEVLRKYLKEVKPLLEGKKNIVFIGMGGSINTIKAVSSLFKDKKINIYTFDSLDDNAAMFIESLNLDDTLVVAISKSATTTETLYLTEIFKNLYGENWREHILFMIDLPNEAKLRDKGFDGAKVIPIQLDKKTDIGGRFTSPHTAIFWLPVFAALGLDIEKTLSYYDEYAKEIEKLTSQVLDVVSETKDAQYFAVVLPNKEMKEALETWITQLFQESLGSKIDDFNPKTIVLSKEEKLPKGFAEIEFNLPSKDKITNMMYSTYLLEVYVALFAGLKNINFVNQPEVERYKKTQKDIKESEVLAIPRYENLSELAKEIEENVKDKKFIEVVVYQAISEKERKQIQEFLQSHFKDKIVLVFIGSDWNHHSYQAAVKNKDTYFVILTENPLKEVRAIGNISKEILERNYNTLLKIAYATYQTLKDKATIGYINQFDTTKNHSQNLTVSTKENKFNRAVSLISRLILIPQQVTNLVNGVVKKQTFVNKEAQLLSGKTVLIPTKSVEQVLNIARNYNELGMRSVVVSVGFEGELENVERFKGVLNVGNFGEVEVEFGSYKGIEVINIIPKEATQREWLLGRAALAVALELLEGKLSKDTKGEYIPAIIHIVGKEGLTSIPNIISDRYSEEFSYLFNKLMFVYSGVEGEEIISEIKNQNINSSYIKGANKIDFNKVLNLLGIKRAGLDEVSRIAGLESVIRDIYPQYEAKMNLALEEVKLLSSEVTKLMKTKLVLPVSLSLVSSDSNVIELYKQYVSRGVGIIVLSDVGKTNIDLKKLIKEIRKTKLDGKIYVSITEEDNISRGYLEEISKITDGIVVSYEVLNKFKDELINIKRTRGTDVVVDIKGEAVDERLIKEGDFRVQQFKPNNITDITDRDRWYSLPQDGKVSEYKGEIISLISYGVDGIVLPKVTEINSLTAKTKLAYDVIEDLVISVLNSTKKTMQSAFTEGYIEGKAISSKLTRQQRSEILGIAEIKDIITNFQQTAKDKAVDETKVKELLNRLGSRRIYPAFINLINQAIKNIEETEQQDEKLLWYSRLYGVLEGLVGGILVEQYKEGNYPKGVEVEFGLKNEVILGRLLLMIERYVVRDAEGKIKDVVAAELGLLNVEDRLIILDALYKAYGKEGLTEGRVKEVEENRDKIEASIRYKASSINKEDITIWGVKQDNKADVGLLFMYVIASDLENRTKNITTEKALQEIRYYTSFVLDRLYNNFVLPQDIDLTTYDVGELAQPQTIANSLVIFDLLMNYEATLKMKDRNPARINVESVKKLLGAV